MAVEVGAARQRIIRRPRLTSMLDDSSARIRLLVAPAGYGKTTLAREWLGEPERRDVWYRGGPASADVAALAAGIAEAASAIVPEAGKRMRDRLRATGQPEEDVDILAELFAEDVQQWPPEAWLAFDDYHHAMESAASERFVDLLTQQTPIQMLITSRRRPSWATARRILYGEVLEIDRRALAMEDSEARKVLGRQDDSSEELISRTGGWPAVLGLAAITEDFVVPPEHLPAALHAYFAEEVLQAADPNSGRQLTTLAIAPVISYGLVTAIFGQRRSRRLIDIGTRLGILTEQETEIFSIHPLLREFLLSQLSNEPEKTTYASRIGNFFLEQAQWDYAFEVASWASLRSLLEKTIADGLDPMLSEGRLATVQGWVDFAVSSHLDVPIVDLAESELAFRRGQHDRAYVLASQAAARLNDGNLAARAHIRAGHSALLSSREAAGLESFRSARLLAEKWELRREALVGLYFAASELGTTDADEVIEELEASEDHSPKGILRLELLRMTRATRTARGVSEAVESALPKLHLAGRTTDPLGLTSFLHTLTWSLNLTARYAEALELADRQVAFALQFRLELPVVHSRLNQAISLIGLGEFQRAQSTLDDVRQHVPPHGDAYLEAAVRAITCRLLTAQRQFGDAVLLTDDEGEGISSPPLRAEYLSFRALALACAHKMSTALAALDRAAAVYASSIEFRVLAPSVETIAALTEGDGLRQRRAASKAWRAAQESGNFDSLVYAYRAEPRILTTVIQEPARRAEVVELLARASDHDVAKQLGISIKRHGAAPLESLTPRELEVLRELRQGLSNRDIARRLFVSESTVKVHLRHIYEKLGVRGRTEAVAKWLAQRGP